MNYREILFDNIVDREPLPQSNDSTASVDDDTVGDDDGVSRATEDADDDEDGEGEGEDEDA